MIRKAIMKVTQMNLENIIMESDSQVTILSITGKTGVPKQLFDVVEDFRNISRSIKDITFFIVNLSTNTLTDKLRKKVHDTPCNIM